MKPKVAVVILNWNGKHFLECFLPNIIQHTCNEAELIIADNASSDDSIEFLKRNYPQLKLIQFESNGGFAKGYNDAFKQIDSDYYVLLNSDLEVSPNWISPIIELMESDENIAVCQPKLMLFDDKKKFEYSGAGGGFIDFLGYPFCRGRLFDSIENDNGQYNDNYEIFWASGAAMFVKAKIYHQFGGLDNDFFAHMEEIDFCWRLKNNGYKIMYCPQSTIYHIGGGTLPKSSSRKTYLNFRNNFFLLYKNLPSSKLWNVLIIRLFLDGIAAIKFLSEGKLGDIVAVAKAHFHFYAALPSLSKKRKLLKQINVSKVYKKSIVWDYYSKKKTSFSMLDESNFSS